MYDKIFESLNLKPNEMFKTEYKNEISDLYYRITENLLIEYSNNGIDFKESYCNLQYFLNGTYIIHKIKGLTKVEKIMLYHARTNNCNWIARDKDGKIFAYKNEPYKNEEKEKWKAENCKKLRIYEEGDVKYTCIKWDDKLPLKIADYIK